MRIADNGELYWLTLFERGRLAERQKDPAGAIGYYTRAVDVIEQQRSTIHSEVNKIGFVGDKQTVYARLIVLLAKHNRAPVLREEQPSEGEGCVSAGEVLNKGAGGDAHEVYSKVPGRNPGIIFSSIWRCKRPVGIPGEESSREGAATYR